MKKITDEQLKDCIKKGMFTRDIAAKYKITTQALSLRFKRLGIKPNRPSPARLGKRTTNKVVKHYTIHPRVISMVDEIAKKEGKKKGVVVEEAIQELYKEKCI